MFSVLVSLVVTFAQLGGGFGVCVFFWGGGGFGGSVVARVQLHWFYLLYRNQYLIGVCSVSVSCI